MLALKTVLADVDNIETFIFDEIDTGISGRAAQKLLKRCVLLPKTPNIMYYSFTTNCCNGRL